MAKPVLYWAAAAGSNYWLGCGKWGQMHCIIREPVDSGSPSQWLVINKIIGERWQRFLEFFLICMSFCTEFFMTSFFICEGWVANDTVSYGVTCLCCGFKLRAAAAAEREERSSMCGVAPVHSQDPIFVSWSNPESFSVQVLFPTAAHHICMRRVNVQQASLSITLSCKKALERCFYIRVPSFSPWGHLSVCIH